jgi:hypothetical protein
MNTYIYINVGTVTLFSVVGKEVEMSLIGVNRGTLQLAVAHKVLA